ncbi:hypothetical protein MTBBW1_840009 [Desulfamplus magnetovallimortis]|uniref:Uncharacterized protein n=1 Tax=Desulfamplus magnetovallimortis TaxID=1246637 RepID=A0A1W1HKI9_9BACT|nr:hypothetical protein MTBBW1_840009 [Desulfamplus magnetovallimortis]
MRWKNIFLEVYKTIMFIWKSIFSSIVERIRLNLYDRIDILVRILL